VGGGRPWRPTCLPRRVPSRRGCVLRNDDGMHGSATVQPSSHSISAPVCPSTLLLFLQRKGLTSEDAESETLTVITNRSSPSRPTTTRYTLGGWPGFRLAARHGRAGATSICEQLARVQGRIGACFVRASRGQQGVWDASVRYPRTRPTHEQTSCRVRRRRPRRCAIVRHVRDAMLASFGRGSKDKRVGPGGTRP
jgi:hypothetical protein